MKQTLSPDDVEGRHAACDWFLNKLMTFWTVSVSALKCIHLHSAVNRQSYVSWGRERPGFMSQKPLHCPCIIVLFNEQSMFHLALILPGRHRQHHNCGQFNYRKAVKKSAVALKRKRIDLSKDWLKQYGATPDADGSFAVQSFNSLFC